MCCEIITVIVVLPHDYSVICCFSSSFSRCGLDAIIAAAVYCAPAVVVVYFFSLCTYFCFCFFFHLFAWFFPRNLQLLLLFALLKMKVAISAKQCVMNCFYDHEFLRSIFGDGTIVEQYENDWSMKSRAINYIFLSFFSDDRHLIDGILRKGEIQLFIWNHFSDVKWHKVISKCRKSIRNADTTIWTFRTGRKIKCVH